MSKESKDTAKTGVIEDVLARDYVKTAYTIYGKYVIEERAVADFRDGLKPVQRRILWAMWNLGLKAGAAFKKSAKVVGETMGNFHPHGDSAIYGSLVTMVWTRYGLIHGQGNFGGVTDPPAAQRYTEARLSKIAHKLFECTDVGEFVPNYAGDQKEPLVLPSRAPFVLLNGSEGIAVGISANIPPHNLSEVVEAAKYVLKNKDKSTVAGAMKYLSGPDYGSGVLISSTDEIRAMYENGYGVLNYRCKYEIEEMKDHKRLIVTSYAPRFNVFTFISKCNALMEENLIEYVADETSDANGTRLVVGYTNDAVLRNRVLPLLYSFVNYQFYLTKRTATQDEAELPAPKFMNLLSVLSEWLDYRREIEAKMIELDINKLRDQLWRQEAIFAAISNLDAIKKCMDLPADEMNPFLVKELSITEQQAEYILDTQLRRLAKFNSSDQKDAIKETKMNIKELKAKLDDIDSVINEQLDALLVFADDRGTDVTPEELVYKTSIADSINNTDTLSIVACSNDGYVAKMADSPILKGKWKWDHLIQTGQKFTFVEQAGMAYTADMSYVKDGDSECRNVIGIIPNTKKKLVALADNGLGIVLEHPQVSLEYKVMRGDADLVEVVGLDEKDQLIAWNNKTYELYKYEDLQTSRKNSSGWLILPRQDKDVHITAWPHGHKLVSSDGDILDMDAFMKVENFYVVGSKNLVIFDDGTRSIGNQKETIGYVKNGGVVKVYNFE